MSQGGSDGGKISDEQTKEKASIRSERERVVDGMHRLVAITELIDEGVEK